MVAIHADFRIGVEIVAERPAQRQRVMIGRYVHTLYAQAVAIAGHVSRLSEARYARRAHHSRAARQMLNIAKDFVERAILFHDHDHVLYGRGQRARRLVARLQARCCPSRFPSPRHHAAASGSGNELMLPRRKAARCPVSPPAKADCQTLGPVPWPFKLVTYTVSRSFRYGSGTTPPSIKGRNSAHGWEGTHRRVDAARKNLLRALFQVQRMQKRLETYYFLNCIESV